MFADLEGSTRLWEEYPEVMKAAWARHDEILRAAVEARTTKMFRDMGRLKRAVVLAKAESWGP